MWRQQYNRDGHAAITWRGYITTTPGNHPVDSDEEEEEEEEEWLDYSQIKEAFSGGTFVKAGKAPRKGIVTIKDYQNKQHGCKGSFILIDPWWDVTVQVYPPKKSGPIPNLVGYPQYALRQDEQGLKGHNLVIMMLRKAFEEYMRKSEGARNAREATDRVMENFHRFVERHGFQDHLQSFEHLEYILSRFALEEPITNKVKYGDVVQTVLRAYKHPRLFSFICRLLPRKFLSCLLGCPHTKLPELETATEDEPWVFGFNMIMMKRFSVYGLEATVKDYCYLGFMERIPPVQKDALYIYEVLKTDARQYGHTFIPFYHRNRACLKRHRHWDTLPHTVDETGWSDALAFLRESSVVVEEYFDGSRNLFLHHNWKSETDIANGLREVIQRGINRNSVSWDVDFSSPDFDRLRGDREQWDSVQRVVAYPITVLCGKGGCGKTTVVTSLTTHVCQRSSKPPPSPKTEENKDSVPGMFAETELPGNSAENRPRTQTHTTASAQSNAKAFPSQNADTSADTSTASSHEGADPSQKDASREKSCVRLTPEQVLELVQTAERNLIDRQSKQRHGKNKRTKEDQIEVDLVKDLIKYLGTTGDTALSRTSAGRRILLTAPTGKAAKLLGHKTKMESCTLHRVIYSYRNFIKQQDIQKREQERTMKEEHDPEFEEDVAMEGTSQQGPRLSQSPQKSSSTNNSNKANSSNTSNKNSNGNANNKNGTNKDATEDGEWKYAKVEVLVVDECSLVSNRLFATLLNILLENSKLWKIVLLGDYRQLPSIEPGNFLEHVFEVLKGKRWGVELLTNHRSESDLIVQNATHISNRKMPHFDPSRNFHFERLEDKEDSGDPERDQAVRLLLMSRVEMKDHVPSQFVTFKNKDCEAINEICCKHYNEHSIRLTDNRKPHFAVGDKICLRKNAQIMNHAMRLRGHLTDFPHILEKFGIDMPSKKKSKKKREGMDVSAAVDEVLKDERTGDGDKAAVEKNASATKRLNRATEIHGTTSAVQAGNQAAVPNGAERIDEGFEDDDFNDDDDQDFLAPSLEGQPGPSTSYNVHPTDFGLRMERSRGRNSDNCIPSLTTSAKAKQSSEFEAANGFSHTGEVGEGERRWGELVESSQPGSSQENEDEEERAGKLKDAEVRLCNGEIFFVMDDFTEGDEGKGRRFLILSDRDAECPRVVCCSFREIMRECRMQHAWARTIHTYQGSESDTVVYFVGDCKFQDWKYVYTAVTRGRKSVFIVGKTSELQAAVSKMDIKRRSRLSHRLTDSIKTLQIETLQKLMQQVMDNAKAGAEKSSSQSSSSSSQLHPSFPQTPSHPSSSSSSSNHTFQFSSSSSSPISFVASPALSVDAFTDSDDSWMRDFDETSMQHSPSELFRQASKTESSSSGIIGKQMKTTSKTESGEVGVNKAASENDMKVDGVNEGKITPRRAEKSRAREQEVGDCLAFLDADSPQNGAGVTNKDLKTPKASPQSRLARKKNPVVYVTGYRESNKSPDLSSPEGSPPGSSGTGSLAAKMNTTSKRQLSKGTGFVTPKKLKSDNSVDSIVSPVRRSLNI